MSQTYVTTATASVQHHYEKSCAESCVGLISITR